MIQLESSRRRFSHQLSGTAQEIALGQAQVDSVQWRVWQLTNSIAEPIPNEAEVALKLGLVEVHGDWVARN